VVGAAVERRVGKRTENRTMTITKKLSGIGLTALATGIGLAAALTPAGAASAATRHVGTIAGVETRCNNSPYWLCLYYNSSARTGYWGTSTDVSDLAGETFLSGTGAGSGQAVKNNAAAASCDLPATGKCWVFFNHGYAGNADYLNGQETGQLSYTYNEDASVKVVF
jgi:hypothetical protein